MNLKTKLLHNGLELLLNKSLDVGVYNNCIDLKYNERIRFEAMELINNPDYIHHHFSLQIPVF